jgi:predicted nuclease of predicted toxin-antitoxin system
VTLLLDQNISHELAARLTSIYPGSLHVRDLGMRSAVDHDIWDYAKNNGLTFVSKEGDYHQMSLLYGAPPKVIWMRVGNISTAAIEHLLRTRQADIADFLTGDGALMVVDP